MLESVKAIPTVSNGQVLHKQNEEFNESHLPWHSTGTSLGFSNNMTEILGSKIAQTTRPLPLSKTRLPKIDDFDKTKEKKPKHKKHKKDQELEDFSKAPNYVKEEPKVNVEAEGIEIRSDGGSILWPNEYNNSHRSVTPPLENYTYTPVSSANGIHDKRSEKL